MTQFNYFKFLRVDKANDEELEKSDHWPMKWRMNSNIGASIVKNHTNTGVSVVKTTNKTWLHPITKGLDGQEWGQFEANIKATLRGQNKEPVSQELAEKEERTWQNMPFVLQCNRFTHTQCAGSLLNWFHKVWRLAVVTTKGMEWLSHGEQLMEPGVFQDCRGDCWGGMCQRCKITCAVE